MGDKVRKKAKVESTETHRLRSMVIVLAIAALSFGVWYFLSERD
jgi:hypothetical protein